jgi:hypothetical protein
MGFRPFKVLPGGAPDSLKKRRLLNDKGLKKELCQRYGEQFLALGWWEDALEFFRKADYEPGLDRLKALAQEAGDSYLLGAAWAGTAPTSGGKPPNRLSSRGNSTSPSGLSSRRGSRKRRTTWLAGCTKTVRRTHLDV